MRESPKTRTSIAGIASPTNLCWTTGSNCILMSRRRLHNSMRRRTGAYGLSCCPPMRAASRALPGIPMEASISMKTPTSPSRDIKIHPRLSIPMGASGPQASRCSDLTRGCVRRCRAQLPTLIRQVNAGSALVYGGTEVPDGSELRLPQVRAACVSSLLRLCTATLSTSTTSTCLKERTRTGRGGASRRKRTTAASVLANIDSGCMRADDDGRVSPEGTYAFTILPPWYRTTLAYILYVLLLMLLAVAGWRYISMYEREKARRKTEALEAQAKVLEATVNERTEEIRAQAAEITAQKESIELLSEIGKEITASLDLNTILFKLYERVNQIVDASIFGVGLYRPEKRLIEYSLAIENGKRYAPYTRSTDDKNQFPVWCIDHRQPILINDVETESSKYIAEYRHTGGMLDDGSAAQPPVSMIYLPLIAQERVLGVLSVQSFKKNAYTEQNLSLLENLAAYTTIALDNANAYLVINQREHEVRERAAELVTINRISQALATQLDKKHLIQLCRRSGARPLPRADRLRLAAGPRDDDAAVSLHLRRGCSAAALRLWAHVADHSQRSAAAHQ